MKQENGFWIDENNNRWNCDCYNKNQAIELSEKLINCTDCRGCTYCTDCTGCRGFNSNPQKISSKKIGRRNSETTVYFNDTKTQIVCGCFRDTLEAFEIQVKKVHIGTKYFDEYMKFIEAVKIFISNN